MEEPCIAAEQRSEGSIISDASIPRLQLCSPDGAVRTLEEIEEEVIRFAIVYHKSRMSIVARSLGIGRSTLYRKLTQFGIRTVEAIE